MEQSAFRLKVEKDKSITDIGYDYGYSPSNYSSVFKKQNNISPSEFRKSKYAECVSNPFYQNKLAKFQSFEEYNQRVIVQELDDFVVVYERYIGNYIELGRKWRDFIEKYKNCFKEAYFGTVTIRLTSQPICSVITTRSIDQRIPYPCHYGQGWQI